VLVVVVAGGADSADVSLVVVVVVASTAGADPSLECVLDAFSSFSSLVASTPNEKPLLPHTPTFACTHRSHPILERPKIRCPFTIVLCSLNIPLLALPGRYTLPLNVLGLDLGPLSLRQSQDEGWRSMCMQRRVHDQEVEVRV